MSSATSLLRSKRFAPLFVTQFLGAFNLPGGKITQGRRDVTNVPAQALEPGTCPLPAHTDFSPQENGRESTGG